MPSMHSYCSCSQLAALRAVAIGDIALGPIRSTRTRHSKSPELRATFMQKRSPVRARAYENTYSMFRKKKQDERVNMARAVRDTLTLESQVASSQVTEGERLLQLLRDNAQVAQLRVEEMNEDIGHMLEEFRQEALTPEEAGSTKTGVGSKFDSDVEAPLSVKGSLDDDTSETNESQDDEEEGRVIKDEAVREVSGSIPLTESALKRLNDSDNNLG